MEEDCSSGWILELGLPGGNPAEVRGRASSIAYFAARGLLEGSESMGSGTERVHLRSSEELSGDYLRWIVMIVFRQYDQHGAAIAGISVRGEWFAAAKMWPYQ